MQNVENFIQVTIQVFPLNNYKAKKRERERERDGKKALGLKELSSLSSKLIWTLVQTANKKAFFRRQ